MIPIKYQHSKKLISHDVNSNTYNYKYTFSVEVSARQHYSTASH